MRYETSLQKTGHRKIHSFRHLFGQITRTRRGSHGYAELKISVVARNNNILKHLVIQARREYEVDMEHRGELLMMHISNS